MILTQEMLALKQAVQTSQPTSTATT